MKVEFDECFNTKIKTIAYFLAEKGGFCVRNKINCLNEHAKCYSTCFYSLWLSDIDKYLRMRIKAIVQAILKNFELCY